MYKTSHLTCGVRRGYLLFPKFPNFTSLKDNFLHHCFLKETVILLVSAHESQPDVNSKPAPIYRDVVSGSASGAELTCSRRLTASRWKQQERKTITASLLLAVIFSSL